MNRYGSAVIFSLLIVAAAGGETFRTIVAGKLTVSSDAPEGSTLSLSYIDSALIALEGDRRFLRGIELEIRVPQPFLKYRGSLAASFYAPVKTIPAEGVADLTLERIGFAILPNKLQAIFLLPVKKQHGLKASPYVSIPTSVIPPASFPALFRLMPVIKGLPEEIETFHFQLHAKPILTEEGALRIVLKYPEKLKDKPLTVLMDDTVVSDPTKELLLGTGEHVLSIVSDFYRNENRRFLVERAKSMELVIELQDPTPVVSVEAPENAKVFFNGSVIADPRKPFNVDPGEHEVRFVIGDYAVVKPISVRKGRTYKIALSIDVAIDESE
ncbi:MAG: hypothetical protein WCT14_00580 [Treponemataceae bacterium]